jgi:hypothetical protein
VVDRAVANDACGPATKRLRIAAEALHVADNLQPRLRGDILGVVADQSGCIAQQPWLRVAVESGERARLTTARKRCRRHPQRSFVALWLARKDGTGNPSAWSVVGPLVVF